MKYCSQCGESADENAKFCQHCGQKFTQNSPLNDIPKPLNDIPKPINTPPKPPKSTSDIPSSKKIVPTPEKSPKKQPKIDLNIPNPYFRYSMGGLVFTGVGLLGMYLGGSGAVDMMDGGGALIFVGLFFAIMGLIIWWIIRRNAKILGDLSRGEGVIGYWEYDGALWERYTEIERARYAGANMTTFAIIAFFAVAVGAAFLFLTDFDEGGVVVALVLAGLLVLLAIVAVVSVWLPYQRRKAMHGGRVVFALNAVWIEGDFYTWGGVGMRLEGCSLEEEEQTLTLHLSSMSRNGRDYRNVILPVPPDELESALGIISQLKKKRA